jgi:peroxiredoxin
MGHESYRPVLAGTEAPGLTVTTLDGDTVRLSDYAGKALLINIWATWCAPCREEMPSMQRLYDSVKSRGGAEDFEILAVSVDATLGQRDAAGLLGGDLPAFAEEDGLTFPILHDPEGAIRYTYQMTAVPESSVIGRDGLIHKKVAGATEWDNEVNEALVIRLLDG